MYYLDDVLEIEGQLNEKLKKIDSYIKEVSGKQIYASFKPVSKNASSS